MPRTAKIFRYGNSQAVRLPREFRFDVGEVEVSREGDAVVLRPHVKNAQDWNSLHAALERGVSDDFLDDWTR
jgi:antitoxin VapB